MYKPLRPVALPGADTRHYVTAALKRGVQGALQDAGVQNWPLDAKAEILLCNQRVRAPGSLMLRDAGLTGSTDYSH